MTTRTTGQRDELPLKLVGTRPQRPDGIDKVTGRARFGADIYLPGMLCGLVLRSPHAHAIIRKIDTSKAEALPGVKAVITRADFPDIPSAFELETELVINFHDLSRNIMADGMVLYDGHPVAAVAATSASIARRALKLIEVDYEVLPHAVDVASALADGAPDLFDDKAAVANARPADAPANLVKRLEYALGDVEAGFRAADVVIEREFRTKPVHQAYIEPHACVATVSEDGQAELWTCTQGQFVVRTHCARILGVDVAKLRVIPSEIGGGFGGKTVVYLEPLALALSRKCHRPVKMVMNRNEIFRSTGPASGSRMRVKMGATKDGRITAGEAILEYEAGAFQGSMVNFGCKSAFACYDIKDVRAVGYDVVVNRPKVASYRAPGAPMAQFAVESVVDEIAGSLSMDPLDLRMKNASREGSTTLGGRTFGPIGLLETQRRAKEHPHYLAPLGPNQGRGVASGFWFNIGGPTSINVNLCEDGTVNVVLGNPDIGGSRASLSMLVAEEFGIELDRVRPIIGDTSQLGYNYLTAGSRTTFASGKVVVEATRDAIDKLRARAAKLWDIPVEAVVWTDGHARPASSNAGSFDPLSLRDLAKKANATGGPIVGHAESNVTGAAPSFGTHIADVEVDIETGRIRVLRYTVLQDAGRAIHPAYVEGQFQGGAAQGIGWALNEEYVYGVDGRLLNPTFLDYRIPVASDLPMMDTVIVEVPNPNHPYGVRGIGETPIIPPLAAVANAVANAVRVRLTDLPMSPPKVLKALAAARTVSRG